MNGNLTTDLLEFIANNKFLNEIELTRLSNDATMNYEEKLYQMDCVGQKIILGSLKLNYFTDAFKTAKQPVQPQQPQQPTTHTHQGQSHGE